MRLFAAINHNSGTEWTWLQSTSHKNSAILCVQAQILHQIVIAMHEKMLFGQFLTEKLCGSDSYTLKQAKKICIMIIK